MTNLFVREDRLVFLNKGRAALLSLFNSVAGLNRIPNSKIHHYLMVYLYFGILDKKYLLATDRIHSFEAHLYQDGMQRDEKGYHFSKMEICYAYA